MKRIFAAALCILSPAVLAGNGWVSSGGEFRKDQNNPWFVKNTKQVRWCLKKSAHSVSLDSARARELVELGLRYWTSQFQNLDASSGVGTQDFLFTSADCSSSEDLQIKIGYDTLDSEELSYISTRESSLEQHAGLTIRKKYDLSLRGQGTIYIASDKGPQRFRSGRGVPESFWRDEGIFLRVLVHELGHFFGLPHEAGGLMAANYPEEIIRRSREQHSDDTRRTDNLPHFFGIPQKQSLCADRGFSVPGFYSRCLQLSWTSKSLQVFAIDDKSDDKIEIPLVENAATNSLDFPLKIFLPKGQTAFPGYPDDSFFRGPARSVHTIVGRLEKFKINLFFHLQPENIHVRIMDEKKVTTILMREKGTNE